MANWKMETAATLKTLIHSEDESEQNCKLILEEIAKEYIRIQSVLNLDEDIFEFELDSLNEDMELETFDIDTVDCHLRTFYDVCDEFKVWVK